MTGRWNITALLRALLATMVMASLGGQAFAHAGHMAAAPVATSAHHAMMDHDHHNHGDHLATSEQTPDRPETPCAWCDRAGGCMGGLVSSSPVLGEPAFRREPPSSAVASPSVGRDDDFAERPPRLI